MSPVVSETIHEFAKPLVEANANETGATRAHDALTLLMGTMQPPFPHVVCLGWLGDGRLRLRRPITVQLSREDVGIVATAQEIDELGFGSDSSEAIRDLQRAIVSLYFTLRAEEHRLGPDLQRVWQILQERIVATR